MGGASGGGASGAGGAGPDESLIGNGDFSTGMEGWNVELASGGPVSIDTNNGRLCVEADTSGAQVVVGWPYAPYGPLTLRPGVDFTFSFRAVGTRAIQVISKLGLVDAPFTSYSTQIVEVSGTWQSFAQGFVLNSGSDNIGVAISFTLDPLAAVCVDDVRLTSP